MRYLLIAGLALLAGSARAQTCAERLDGMKRELEGTYPIGVMRAARMSVEAAMTPEERTELESLADRFKTVMGPGLSESNSNDLFAMQGRSSVIVRTIARRAGYRLLKGEAFTGIYGDRVHGYDSYDAVIGDWKRSKEIVNSDGSKSTIRILDYIAEVRVLLIDGPSPSAVLNWDSLGSKKPFDSIRSISVESNGRIGASCRVGDSTFRGTLEQCLTAALPAECRAAF